MSAWFFLRLSVEHRRRSPLRVRELDFERTCCCCAEYGCGFPACAGFPSQAQENEDADDEEEETSNDAGDDCGGVCLGLYCGGSGHYGG